jgi:RNA polymerase sigma-70 factor (ECF subfamily)
MLQGAVSLSGAEIAELQPVMQRFALRATRDPELARELVQEALVAAVAQSGEFAGRSSLRTWVIGILSHKVIDHFRRRSLLVDGSEERLLEAPSPEDLERVIAARQELGRVERALRALPELERMALLMVDVEGVDREESRNALGVSATHLRVLLHRGRNRLREMLQNGE